MEAARPLKGYTQNRYNVTSTMLCWSKQVIRPAQIQGRGIKLCFLKWEGHAYLGRGKLWWLSLEIPTGTWSVFVEFAFQCEDW